MLVNKAIRSSTRTLVYSTQIVQLRFRHGITDEQLNSVPIFKKIHEDVQKNKLLLFMKGTPDYPMCGFSKQVVQILKFNGVDKIEGRNVLEDDELRDSVKIYSDWPTFPQLYINGELVGGCDIVTGMHTSGELANLLKESGIVKKE